MKRIGITILFVLASQAVLFAQIFTPPSIPSADSNLDREPAIIVKNVPLAIG